MPPRRFGCKDCNHKYGTKQKLVEHRKVHQKKNECGVTKEKSCPTCQKIFVSAVLLKRHVIICKSKDEDSAKKTVSEEVILPDKADDTSRKIGKPKAGLKAQMSNKVQFLLDGTKQVIDISSESGENGTGCSGINGINAKDMSLKNSIASSISINVAEDDAEDLSLKSSISNSGKNSLNAVEKINRTNQQDVQIILVNKELHGKKNAKNLSSKKAKISKSKSPKTTKTDAKIKKLCSSKANLKKKENIQLEIKKENDVNIQDETSEKKDKNGQTLNKDHSSGNSAETNVPSVRQFTCAHCNKCFSRKYHLDRHLNMSPCSGLPPMSFPCQVCHRVYSRKDNLREHLRVHTGEIHRKLKHKCHFCDKAFHAASLLTIHVRKHTGEKPFSCEFCPKKFPSTGGLAKHRRTHTGEKPFACPQCGHRFSLKGTLNRHLHVHSGIRPHKCLYCGKQFIQIGGLKAHLFYHTGENGFKCDDCGKVFNRKARLQMHKLYVHVKLRPFTCENCSKSFTRKEDLHRHAILHTGEKPFKCPTCNKSFAIKPSLKLHLLTHIKEEPRSCHECGRAFIRKDCLLRHMRKRHRDLLDKILLDEKDEKSGEVAAVTSRILSEEDLCENIQELLSLLVEESTLIGFGWPSKPVDEVLEAVIRRCGHMPVSPGQYSYMDRMRENAKLLFTVVIDDNAVKTLLNNQTVDEVILHVLRLAKT